MSTRALTRYGSQSLPVSVLGRRSVRRLLALLCAALVIAAGFAVLSTVHARGSAAAVCQRHAGDSAARARLDTGSGPAVTVIGDSWSVGLGLDDLRASWPSRLPGRVHVAGFSGSGFSEHASSCGGRMFATRAAASRGAGLVVLEGGLNDFDQPTVSIRDGFTQAIAAVHRAAPEARIVVVGPASAPSRARAVPRVNAELARLSDQHGTTYIDTSGWTLPYLEDRLHLTAAGHVEFGDLVAEELRALGVS